MDWEDFKRTLLSDPEVRAHYERLEPRYRIAEQSIKLRRRLSMTQAELAAQMGTTQSVVSRLESANGNVTLRTLERLAEVLGCVLKVSLEPKNSEESVDSLLERRASTEGYQVHP